MSIASYIRVNIATFANITASVDGQHTSTTSSRWTELTAVTHSRTALVPGSSPPVIVGGWNHSDKHQQQISRHMTTLTTHGGVLGHYHLLGIAVAAVDNNAFAIIGGCSY